jgi:hypothetical protein
MLGDDENQIGAHSALLAASKQSEDGRIPHLNGSFPVFILDGRLGQLAFEFLPHDKGETSEYKLSCNSLAETGRPVVQRRF